MALYRLSQSSTVTTSGNCAADMACSTGVRPKLMEWDLFNGAATALTSSLRRSTSLGTRTTPVALVPEEPGDPALTGINLIDMAVAFTGEPAEATAKLAAIALPATIGTGVIWTFPRGMTLANSLSFVIIHDAISSALHLHTCVADC